MCGMMSKGMLSVPQGLGAYCATYVLLMDPFFVAVDPSTFAVVHRSSYCFARVVRVPGDLTIYARSESLVNMLFWPVDHSGVIDAAQWCAGPLGARRLYQVLFWVILLAPIWYPSRAARWNLPNGWRRLVVFGTAIAWYLVLNTVWSRVPVLRFVWSLPVVAKSAVVVVGVGIVVVATMDRSNRTMCGIALIVSIALGSVSIVLG